MPTTASKGATVKLKVCLAGETAVGKTSLVRRFAHDIYEDRHVATLGVKFTKKELVVMMPGSGEPGHVVLTIWDIMGDEMFREFLRDSYFHGAQAILAVCDLTRPETLTELEGWRYSIWERAGSVPVYVLANKVDLTKEARLRGEDLEAFCEGWGGCPYLLTSAKTGENVEEAFEGLTSLVLEAQLRRRAVPA